MHLVFMKNVSAHFLIAVCWSGILASETVRLSASIPSVMTGKELYWKCSRYVMIAPARTPSIVKTVPHKYARR